jgi:hypothetical protein
MLEGMIDVHAECKTTDGRRIGWFARVSPFLFEDEPAFRGLLLADLQDTAARGDPPGVLDEATLKFGVGRPLGFPSISGFDAEEAGEDERDADHAENESGRDDEGGG